MQFSDRAQGVRAPAWQPGDCWGRLVLVGLSVCTRSLLYTFVEASQWHRLICSYSQFFGLG